MGLSIGSSSNHAPTPLIEQSAGEVVGGRSIDLYESENFVLLGVDKAGMRHKPVVVS